jgi:hypothetical protein
MGELVKMRLKKKQKITIILAIIGIFLIWYFGLRTFSLSDFNATPYSSYQWQDSNTLIVSSPSSFGTYLGNEFSNLQGYYHSSTNNPLCSSLGVIDGVCAETTDWTSKAQTMVCSISGTLSACFEGENCPQGEASGDFNAEGIVSYNYGTLLCDISGANMTPFTGPGSSLYTQWFSKPGRVSGWNRLLVTSGTIRFLNHSLPECPSGETKCSDGICRVSCETGECPTGKVKCPVGDSFQCLDKCEEEKAGFMIYIIIGGMIILVVGLAYLYYMTKK